MLQTIIADIQQIKADIKAGDWFAVAKDFAKLMTDVAGSAGSVPTNDPGLENLKANLHDLHALAAAAAGGHPILSQLLQALIAALPTIIAILTGKPAGA